jgi:3'-5' exoribonuclease
MTRRLITELQPQEQIDQVFRAADKQLRANRQGGKYILLKLADRSGTLTGMLWNAEDSTFESFERGDFIRCRGRLQTFNGGLQMIVTDVDKVARDDVDLADFERFDASKADSLEGRLNELIESLKSNPLKHLGQAFLADADFMGRFRQAAAAITNHHAYPGGLLQHTVDLMELAELVTPRYPRADVDLVKLGAFLHDLGKVEELASGDELTYTDRGQLVGHIVIGVQMLADKIRIAEQQGGFEFPTELRWQLEHLILSHHGQLEFGSPKIPMTVEAILLHHLDNLDAKMAAADAVIEADVSTDSRWTNYNPSFGRKLWKAPAAPNSES